MLELAVVLRIVLSLLKLLAVFPLSLSCGADVSLIFGAILVVLVSSGGVFVLVVEMGVGERESGSSSNFGAIVDAEVEQENEGSVDAVSEAVWKKRAIGGGSQSGRSSMSLESREESELKEEDEEDDGGVGDNDEDKGESMSSSDDVELDDTEEDSEEEESDARREGPSHCFAPKKAATDCSKLRGSRSRWVLEQGRFAGRSSVIDTEKNEITELNIKSNVNKLCF